MRKNAIHRNFHASISIKIVNRRAAIDAISKETSSLNAMTITHANASPTMETDTEIFEITDYTNASDWEKYRE